METAMDALGAVFLLIFCITLFVTYILIRRGLMGVLVTSGLCAVVTITSVMAFALTEERSLLHSLVAGVVVGLGFTFAIVAMAVFFARNQPDDLEAYLKQEGR